MPKVELPSKENAYRFRGTGVDVIAELPKAAADRVRQGHDITVTVEWADAENRSERQ